MVRTPSYPRKGLEVFILLTTKIKIMKKILSYFRRLIRKTTKPIVVNPYSNHTREYALFELIHRQTPRAYNTNFSGGCTYSHEYNGGCAIGCLLTKSELKFIPFTYLTCDVARLIDKKLIPNRLVSMGGEFLTSLQLIHDRSSYWINPKTAEKAKDGLVWNNSGRERINYLIYNYNLNISPLNKLPN